MKDDPKQTILTFARDIGEAHLDPEETARKRGWLDDEGAVTKEGEALIEELTSGKSARTVLRGNY